MAVLPLVVTLVGAVSLVIGIVGAIRNQNRCAYYSEIVKIELGRNNFQSNLYYLADGSTSTYAVDFYPRIGQKVCITNVGSIKLIEK